MKGDVHVLYHVREGSSLIFFLFRNYCQTPDLGLRLGVDFTFNLDNNDNDNNNHKNNPYLNFLKGTVLGGKEQGHKG